MSILDCRRRTDGNQYRVDRPSDRAQLCTERTVTVPTRNLVELRTVVIVLPQVGRCTLSAACDRKERANPFQYSVGQTETQSESLQKKVVVDTVKSR